MFKIAKRVVKTYQDIVGKQCIRNDIVFAASDENEKNSLKII